MSDLLPGEGDVGAVLAGAADYAVVCGDCMDVLPTLPAGCVDAVVTDPPYGMTNEAYDRGVPDGWGAALFGVAAENAAVLSFAGNPTYHRIAGNLEAGGWSIRQMWAWVFKDGMITSAYPREGFDRLAPAFDPICYATRGKVLLNVQRSGEAWSRSLRQRCGLSDRSRASGLGSANGRYERCIASDGEHADFQYFSLARTGGGAFKSRHVNEKPLALISWLVGKLPGAVILDPFAGSGTTGVAAIQTGRRVILCEIDPTYTQTARRRCADAWIKRESQPALPTFEGPRERARQARLELGL